MIEFHFRDVEVPDLDPSSVAPWLIESIEKEGVRPGAINVIFVSDEFLYEMNCSYLNHDYYTDIITFDYGDDDCVIGDLFVSVDRLRDNAETFGCEFNEELLRVIIHGILHLCGYKDKSDDEIILMRMKENEYLRAYVSRET